MLEVSSVQKAATFSSATRLEPDASAEVDAPTISFQKQVEKIRVV